MSKESSAKHFHVIDGEHKTEARSSAAQNNNKKRSSTDIEWCKTTQVDERNTQSHRLIYARNKNSTISESDSSLNADNDRSLADLLAKVVHDDPCEEVAEWLCGLRKNLNERENSGAKDRTELLPLHFVVSKGILKLQAVFKTVENDELFANAIAKNITYVVSKGADPNALDNIGRTPLHYAVMSGNVIIAKELLKCAAKLEIRDKNNKWTALHIACLQRSCEMVKLLMDYDADPRAADCSMCTPMHIAAVNDNAQVFQCLFKLSIEKFGIEFAMAALRDEDNEKSTALHWAIGSDSNEIVNFMLAMGIDPNTRRGGRDCTPLQIACKNGNLAIVQSLIEKGANLDDTNQNNESPLHVASIFNQHYIVEYLLNNCADVNACDIDGFTPFLVAVSNDCVESVIVLIKKGASLLACNHSNCNALHLAAKNNSIKVLKLLLTADPFLPEELAEFHSSFDILRGLIDRVATWKYTPLHFAAEWGHGTICKLLLDNNAEIVLHDFKRRTPLHLAAKNGHTNVVRELLRHKLSIKRSICRIISERDEKRNSALHLAALQGHEIIVEELCEAGAYMKSRNRNLLTPLDCAAKNGWAIVAEILLRYGAPIDTFDEIRTTPLHLASIHGNIEVVQLLLENGAGIGFIDSEGRNCLDLAIENDNKEVANTIISDENWKDALRKPIKGVIGEYVVDTPFRNLIRRMPDVAAAVLERCTKTEKQSEHIDYSIEFNYEFIDDTYVVPDDTTEVFSTKGELNEKARPYSKDRDLIRENHPLQVMVEWERTNLLSHPLSIGLLRHKWNSYGFYFYYGLLTLYITFTLMLTIYAIRTPAPFNVNGTDVSLSLAANDTCYHIDAKQSVISVLCKTGILALAVILLIVECYQCYVRRWKYLLWHNLMEWVIYTTAIIFVTDFSECTSSTGLRQLWQWQLGSVCVFLAWINLVLMIRRSPRSGIYVVMFTHILKTFSRFFLVFLLFVIAFAMSFFMLFQNRAVFSDVRMALMKTSVMMVGELDFDSLFSTTSDKSDFTFNQLFAYAFFMFFLVVMTILLMNLMIGLAVGDIKGVREKAVLNCLAMQVDLVLDLERALPEKMIQYAMLGQEKLYLNQPNIPMLFLRLFRNRLNLLERLKKPFLIGHRVLKHIRRDFKSNDDTFQLNIKAIAEQIHINREQNEALYLKLNQERFFGNEVAQLKLNQERFSKELDNITTQQRKLHSMMAAVMGHFKIELEVQDD